MPGPTIQEPKDAIVRITTTNICASYLRTYEGRTPAEPGFIFGHEDQGIVEEVDDGCAKVKTGDRVSMPFNLGCGFWFNCERGQTDWKAVAAFEISGDRDDLIAGWETLLDRWPDSERAKKASYVRG